MDKGGRQEVSEVLGFSSSHSVVGLSWWLSDKGSTCQRCGLHPWVGEDPLEEEIAAHSSTLAWEIPETEEPGGLQSMGLHRVRRDLVT